MPHDDTSVTAARQTNMMMTAGRTMPLCKDDACLSVGKATDTPESKQEKPPKANRSGESSAGCLAAIK
jgi:hypothetical protein